MTKMNKKVPSWVLPAESQGMAGDRLIKIRVHVTFRCKNFKFILGVCGMWYNKLIKVER